MGGHKVSEARDDAKVVPHTPGPWRSGRSDMIDYTNDKDSPMGKHVYADDDRASVHHVTGDQLPLAVAQAMAPNSDEALANARLIAAAPEMLESLRELRGIAWALSSRSEDDFVNRLIAKADAVIAKLERRDV